MDYFHGVKIHTIDDGARPIQVAGSEVIGLVGTAPNVLPATAAVATWGELLFTAAVAGKDSNALSVVFVTGETSVITVEGATVTCTLAADATEADLIKLLAASSAAVALMTGAQQTGDGTKVVAPGTVSLAGGVDEPFPLNKCVLVTTNQSKKLALLGQGGSIGKALQIAGGFCTCTVVVVRVAEGGTDIETAANVAGSATALTGVYALKAALSEVGVAPRILGAPFYSEDESVASALFAVAQQLNAYAYCDVADDATEAAAITHRKLFDSYAGMMCYPYQLFLNAQTKKEEHAPLSAFVMGARVLKDQQAGWETTVSSSPIVGSRGNVTPIDYSMGDSNNAATRLNGNHITTVTNLGAGNVIFGCRSLTTDTQKMFEPWGRARGVIYDSLIYAHRWAIDRKITSTYVEDVTDGVQDFLDRLKAQGKILNGVCWADSELNTEGSIMLGQVWWDFDYAVPAPAEQLNFNAHINSSYYGEVIG